MPILDFLSLGKEICSLLSIFLWLLNYKWRNRIGVEYRWNPGSSRPPEECYQVPLLSYFWCFFKLSSSASVKFPGLMLKGCSMSCLTLYLKCQVHFPKRFLSDFAIYLIFQSDYWPLTWFWLLSFCHRSCWQFSKQE